MNKPIVYPKKVVDIVFMRERVGNDSILDFIMKMYDYMGNNSYVGYTVGERKDEDGYWDKEDSFENTWKFRVFDKLLMDNYGLKEGEELLLLIWW